MWELWASDVTGPTMNSRNHHMFSSVGIFVRELAGMALFGTTAASSSPSSESESSLLLRVGGCCNAVQWANLTQVTAKGEVRFAWQLPKTAGVRELALGSAAKQGPFGDDVLSTKVSDVVLLLLLPFFYKS